MQRADFKDKKYLLSILGLKNKTSVSKVSKKNRAFRRNQRNRGTFNRAI